MSKIPQIPKLLIPEPDEMQIDLDRRHVQYVHGTNSSVFEGLVQFRALLTMAEIDGTPWFHKTALKSGERGYTLQDLSQPISQGVSFYSADRYASSIHYSKLGDKEYYQVLIGVDHGVELSRKITDHPLSVGGVNIDHILVIYVPSDQYDDAVRRLAPVFAKNKVAIFPSGVL
jgi:hypothetical protein